MPSDRSRGNVHRGGHDGRAYHPQDERDRGVNPADRRDTGEDQVSGVQGALGGQNINPEDHDVTLQERQEVATALSGLRLNENQLNAISIFLTAQRNSVAYAFKQAGLLAPPAPGRDQREEAEAQERAQQDRATKAAQDVRKRKNEFTRVAPAYHLGTITWNAYIYEFRRLAEDYDLSEEFRKFILYRSLKAEAGRIAGERMQPDAADNINLPFNDYAEKLKGLFEPASETETAKMEFKERKQELGENPSLYFADKLTLFRRAWTVGQRDMQMFYDETTKGLVNENVKKGLREYEPTDEADYDRKLKFLSSVTRKRFMYGEISHSDAMGAESFAPLGSYKSVGRTPAGLAIKDEVNATTQVAAASGSNCYYCNRSGHWMANCPKKRAGLTPGAAAVEQQDVEAEDSDVNNININNSSRGRYRTGGRRNYGRGQNSSQKSPANQGSTYSGRGQPFGKRSERAGPGRNTPRRFRAVLKPPGISTLERAEEPQEFYLEEVSDEEQEAETAEEPPKEGAAINTIELDDRYDEEDFSEADLIPTAFLGQ